MNAWREHFLDRYFAYRDRYVEAVRAREPARTRLAIAAETVRLSFVLFGCSLCALILWIPAAGAFARGSIGAGAVLTGACAAAASVLAIRTAAGLVRALGALRKRSDSIL
ncbi:MAG: hypothetical protein ACREM8_08125 [Vulcanimicrobiaceae bacterium]